MRILPKLTTDLISAANDHYHRNYFLHVILMSLVITVKCQKIVHQDLQELEILLLFIYYYFLNVSSKYIVVSSHCGVQYTLSLSCGKIQIFTPMVMWY